MKEEIEHQRIIIGTPCLYINAYSLLRYPGVETLRARNILALNQQWGCFPIIIFKVWDRLIRHEDKFTFHPTPQDLFYKVFGKYLCNKTHDIKVMFDIYEAPRNYQDKKDYITQENWKYDSPYYVDNLNEEKAEIHDYHKSPWDTPLSDKWYKEHEIQYSTLFFGPWLVHHPEFSKPKWKDMEPIAGGYTWESHPHRIEAITKS